MKTGDTVQVWSETEYKCLGWGKIIEIAYAITGKTAKGFIFEKKGVPLIQLESGKTIWGDQCSWIEEKRAIKIGVRLFRDIMREPGSK